MNLIMGLRSDTGQIFNPSSFDLAKSYGITTVFANCLNIFIMVIAQAVIVEKAYKCLDFTLTVFIIHLVSIWISTFKFPWSFEWWVIHAVLVTVTTVLAEWTCMYLE